MRHNVAGKKFSRSSSHRKAMFRNMARSLVTYERIRTTETKAKELSKVADRLVTLALRNDVHARRQAYQVLENRVLVQKLFDEIGPRFNGVAGGFTRVVKLADPRKGDCAPMAVIEFSLLEGETPTVKEKKAAPVAEPAPEPVAEESVAEEPVAEEAEAPEAVEAAAEEAPAEAPAEAAADVPVDEDVPTAHAARTDEETPTPEAPAQGSAEPADESMEQTKPRDDI